MFFGEVEEGGVNDGEMRGSGETGMMMVSVVSNGGEPTPSSSSSSSKYDSGGGSLTTSEHPRICWNEQHTSVNSLNAFVTRD